MKKNEKEMRKEKYVNKKSQKSNFNVYLILIILFRPFYL